jgi:hypothetical protein
MAKQRTDTSRYPSNYGGGWISESQYLTECLCVLIAKQEGKGLEDRFWQKEPWTRIFRRQVPLVLALLKEYPSKVILNALRDRRCWKIRSFGAKWLLEPLLKQYKRTYDAEIMQQSNKIMTRTSTTQTPRRSPNKKKSLFEHLK